MLFAAGRFVALEALCIKVHDVDFDADPVKLFIRGDEGHSFVYRADEYKYRTRRVSDSDKEKVNFQHTVGTMILISTLEGLWTVLENVAKNTVVIIASTGLERFILSVKQGGISTESWCLETFRRWYNIN